MRLDVALQVRQELNRAEVALAGYQIATARQAVAEALRIDPADGRARILQTRLDLIGEAAHLERALGELDARDLYHPDTRHNPTTTFLRAQALCQSDADASAERLLNELIEQYPDDIRPHQMLAALHLKRGEKSQTTHALRELLRLSPRDLAVRCLLADLLAEQDQEQAVDMVMRETSLAIDPVMQLWAARQYRRQSRLRDADDMYCRILKKLNGGEEDATTWAEAGTLADELGATDVAAQRLQHAIDIAPSNAHELHAALALAQMHAGNFRQAGGNWLAITRSAAQNNRAWAGVLICAYLSDKPSLVER